MTVCVVVSAARPHPQLALTQKDMCLLFVAFASWAMKTSNLQAPDAWKTGMYSARVGGEKQLGQRLVDAALTVSEYKIQAYSL